MGYFKDVTPESAGISSKGILNFLDRMEESQIELHSFMVIRHGQCAAKGWWKPYDEKFRHPLYSFSKSLTATAIGFAEQEGILSLDEKIVDIFPDLLPENRRPRRTSSCPPAPGRFCRYPDTYPHRTGCDTLLSPHDAHDTEAHHPVKSLLLQRVSPFRKGVRPPAIFLLCVCLPLFMSSFS